METGGHNVSVFSDKHSSPWSANVATETARGTQSHSADCLAAQHLRCFVDLFMGYSATTHNRLMPSSRVCGAMLPSSYVFKAWWLTIQWRSPFWELNGPLPVNEFPPFYATRKFTTTFKTASHLSISWTRSIQVQGFFEQLVICLSFLECENVNPSPNHQADHPFSAVRGCLFNIFAATLHIWGPVLHPQPEDAPCRGDRDALITSVASGFKFQLLPRKKGV